MTRSTTANWTTTARERLGASRGIVTVVLALILLVLLGKVAAPSSVSHGAILGMLPFASVLAIAALGQTLVVMQGGIDLSVAGNISLVVVIITHEAYGHDSKVLPAVLVALGAAILAGLVNGFLVGRLGLNAIVATLGTNALLYSAVLGVSGGTPRQTTNRMADIAGGESFGIPNAVYFALVAVVITTIAVKRTVAGRRFEAVGANAFAAWTTGLKVARYRGGAYVWAAVLYWLAGALLAGIINKPTAYQGDTYVLAVGGRRGARRYVAARRARQSRRKLRGCGLPHPTRAIRAGTGRHFCRPDPGAGGGSHDRRRAVHRQLVKVAAPPTKSTSSGGRVTRGRRQ